MFTLLMLLSIQTWEDNEKQFSSETFSNQLERGKETTYTWVLKRTHRAQNNPTRNIMQDLVKNLARIWQDFLACLTYLVHTQDLVRFVAQDHEGSSNQDTRIFTTEITCEGSEFTKYF